MIVPKVPMEEFEKLGFKKCKKPYNECYYLCFARGIQYIFLSPVMLKIVEWKDDDPRVHKNANCRYRDNRTALDFMIELAAKGMIESDCMQKSVQTEGDRVKIKESDLNDYISGAKRCNIDKSEWIKDWFVGTGKDNGCFLEGTWWDMICLARNILADENTEKCARKYYKPEWKNSNYCGEEKPYEIIEEREDNE